MVCTPIKALRSGLFVDESTTDRQRGTYDRLESGHDISMGTRSEVLPVKIRSSVMVLFLVLSFCAWGADGVIAVKSPHQVGDTIDRLEMLVTEKGMTLFARIDHAAGAAKVGKALRPTQLLIFGNPRGGTPFMVCAQTVAIDLPLKMLAWQDEGGQVWLAYNDREFLAKRHGVPDCLVAQKIADVLAEFTALAVAP
jgi:uncharacterized protein (DUF302 family)